MSEPVILVLGATGKVGRRLVPRLRALGFTVRAASRSGPVRFDWTEPVTWLPAIAGATAVFLVVPDEPVDIELFLQTAALAGVGRCVVLSGRGVEIHRSPGMLAAERAVRSSDVDWTILQPNNFDQNFDEDLFHAPLLTGELALPVGDAPEPFIDVEDVAEVAARVLIEDGHSGATYVLSGPEALDFATAVAEIAKASGRDIRFVDVTEQLYIDQQVAAGMPREVADYLVTIFRLIRNGDIAPVSDDVSRLLGRPAGTFAAYARRSAAAWS